MPFKPPVLRRQGEGTTAERRVDRDRFRGSASSRGYDRTWQRLRLQVLNEEPLCRWCAEKDKLEAATVVDHIQPIAERPDLRLVRSNLRALCKRCHDQHTASRGRDGRDQEPGRQPPATSVRRSPPG